MTQKMQLRVFNTGRVRRTEPMNFQLQWILLRHSLKTIEMQL